MKTKTKAHIKENLNKQKKCFKKQKKPKAYKTNLNQQ